MDIKLIGSDKLAQALADAKTLSQLKKIIRVDGALLQREMQRQTTVSFVKRDPRTGLRYSTGQTKRSIMAPAFSDGGLTAKVKPTTEYAAYVEYGTRFMDAEPFVRPAHERVSAKFHDHVRALVE